MVLLFLVTVFKSPSLGETTKTWASNLKMSSYFNPRHWRYKQASSCYPLFFLPEFSHFNGSPPHVQNKFLQSLFLLSGAHIFASHFTFLQPIGLETILKQAILLISPISIFIQLPFFLNLPMGSLKENSYGAFFSLLLITPPYSY